MTQVGMEDRTLTENSGITETGASRGEAEAVSDASRGEAEAVSGTRRTRRSGWVALAILLVAGVLVYLPALRSRFILDDYIHASMIDGTFPVQRSPFDLYNFVDDADRAILLERGMLPWWSHPRLAIRFFRPLPSALLWADHRLFGNAPLPLHLHSLVWWVTAVLAARALFRRLLPARPALIATFIFALAPCHALPLAWLANREALVSLTFGTVALGAYLRWREGRRLGDGALAAAFFSLALLGGEYALCFGGYVLALELGTRGERPVQRALGLLPFAAPAAAYLAVRARLGYGTAGSGFYTDPFREPLAFLRLVPRRLVTLLADGWLSLDHETLISSTPWWALALIAAPGVALLVVPLRRTFAGLDEARRGTARWMLLGSVLALGPVLAVVPSPRLLGASLLGVAATVALVLEHAWFATAPAPPDAPRSLAAQFVGLVAVALGFSHLVHGPATAFLVARHFQGSAADFSVHAAELQARLDDPASAEVMVVRGMGSAFFAPFALDPHGRLPARWRMLSQTGPALVLRRGPTTLDLVVARDQGVFPPGQDNLYRNDLRVAVGDSFDLPGVRATILELGQRGPRSVRFEFDRDLEDLSLTWITDDRRGFQDATPPEEGFGRRFDP
jgi:hypothetical protein